MDGHRSESDTANQRRERGRSTHFVAECRRVRAQGILSLGNSAKTLQFYVLGETGFCMLLSFSCWREQQTASFKALGNGGRARLSSWEMAMRYKMGLTTSERACPANLRPNRNDDARSKKLARYLDSVIGFVTHSGLINTQFKLPQRHPRPTAGWIEGLLGNFSWRSPHQQQQRLSRGRVRA